MDKIKKYMKPIITWIVLLFIYLFLLVILNYFQILKYFSKISYLLALFIGHLTMCGIFFYIYKYSIFPFTKHFSSIQIIILSYIIYMK